MLLCYVFFYDTVSVTAKLILFQGSKSAHERLFGTSTASRSGTILQKHAVKKPKRRHYTVSGYQYMLDPQFSQYFTVSKYFPLAFC